jgi:hypothetical protein
MYDTVSSLDWRERVMIAAEAAKDPRTIHRWADGAPVRASTVRAIQQAAKKLGLADKVPMQSR